MITDIDEILCDLDKHASEFNFPVLDNAYMQFGAARLTAFRGTNHWLVVFEVLGFSIREVQFVSDLYAYGSCVELGGLAGEEIPFTSPTELPILDPETNECVADWKNWAITIENRTLRFSPTPDEYAEAGVHIEGDPGRGTLNEANLLRYAVFRLREQLFLREQKLLSHFPKCKGLSKFIQTTEWQHPDVAAGEKPSENVAIRSLLHALAKGDPLLFQPGSPNTDWKLWVQTTQ